MKKLFFALTAATLLTSCSGDTVDSGKVSQDEIHQFYSVEFNEEKQSTTAIAEFRVGGASGTTVSLQAPSVVRFNGRDLGRQNFLGTRYTVEVSGGMTPDTDWEYIDGNGKSYKNTITVKPIYLVSQVEVISRSSGQQIEYEAKNLGSDESVEAEIISKDGKATALATNRTPGSPLNLAASELSRLPTGPAFLTLKRTKRVSVQSGTRRGGSLYSQYLSRKIPIVIK